MAPALANLKVQPFSLLTMDDESFDKVSQLLRWPETGGQPVCPKCRCLAAYEVRTRERHRCMKCYTEFTLTSGTALAGIKLSRRKLLFGLSCFLIPAIGISALELAQKMEIADSAAAVFSHRIRELMAREQHGRILTGIVEVDGCAFGGHLRQENKKWERVDLRKVEAKVQCLVALRQRKGPTVTAVFAQEKDCIDFVRQHVAQGAMIVSDEALHWHQLAAWYEVRRINHKKQLASFPKKDVPIYTNNAESFFNRVRKAEDLHYHISGTHLALYGAEQAWRHDHRNDTPAAKMAAIIGAAVAQGTSRFTGYYQRRTGRNSTRRADPNKVRNPARRRALLKAAAGPVEETCAQADSV